ncbi:NAD(P)/FAD-dependent oxidoreductase [Candidatus Gracilibacteria bacterium]|nr:NAD(P)/FAD-dependent oxidoreductase [Candidatus Gracilibacteria bacterium]
MKQYDVIIVGASFAGLSCARALLAGGKKVMILELKKDIRKHIHTTGIIVDEAFEEWKPKKSLLKKINKVKLYSPSLEKISIQSDDYTFYATDTGELIYEYYKEILELGGECRLDYNFKGAEYNNDSKLYSLANLKISAPIIVGADGVFSPVAKYFGLGRNSRFLYGVEYEFSYDVLEGKELEGFHCFTNQDVSLGYLGWIVPGVKTVQVGLATFQTEKPEIDRFLNSISDVFNFDKKYLLTTRGGVIPTNGVVEPFYQNNVFLVGDAAGTMSPLTAGGIHTAMRYGRKLGEHISQNFDNPEENLEKYIKTLPKFKFKRLLSKAYVSLCKNWMLNLLFKTKIIFPIAKIVFFLKKKLK